MNETDVPTAGHNEFELTEIRVQGHLDEHWRNWFTGLTIAHEENGGTRLTGLVPDQPALCFRLMEV